MKTAPSLHRELLAALARLASVEQQAVLLFAEIQSRRLYRELGYSTMIHYARDALGFSRQKAHQFFALAESFGKLPELKRAVSGGELSWTKAREVAKLATPRTERKWINEAKKTSNRELERRVRARRAARRKPPEQGSLLPVPESLPAPRQRVGLDFAPEDFARFEALIEAARKRGFRGSREDVLLALMEAGLSENVTRVTNSTPYQIVIYQCDTCKTAKVKSTRGDLALSRSVTEQVACDAQVLGADGRNRSSIPPALRKRVLARDGHRCQAPGCGGRQFLEVHHRIPRAEGGGNEVGNLVTLCASCHRLLHENGGMDRVLAKREASAVALR